MFEIIGMVVVAWLVWVVVKAVLAGTVRTTLIRAVKHAEGTGGVPRQAAMRLLDHPEVVKGVRQELAAADPDFGALDLYKQYGLAIVEIHSRMTSEQVVNRQVESILAPQISKLQSEDAFIAVDYITFVYVGALVLAIRQKDKKRGVTPAEIKNIIEHLFVAPDHAFLVENAWHTVLHSSSFFQDVAAMLPTGEKEIAAGRGEYFVKYVRKFNQNGGLATGPRRDLSQVSSAWFLEV